MHIAVKMAENLSSIKYTNGMFLANILKLQDTKCLLLDVITYIIFI